ncbi:M67 family metallopeptidase [Actinomadura sp. 6K520]|uniref:Mov34/MPN/PAD-1 family protein n=1 Tax=Actinomadura sp. 6K520 TaxID=2530364 RepID=UPI0010540088|nr:M67 family metallopeptidase [Actinomadura sp. 6K520]TDE33102.1 M67 family peptidase [Actinomadura sp. 6K520]
MLTIERALVDKIIAHARADHPDEACGIVAGPEGSDRPTRFVPMTNAERSPTYHSFDNDEWYRVDREMFDNDEEMVVHYHSHTSTEAYPSRTDLDYLRSSLADPRVHRVIVSTREPDRVEFRSYLLVDGEPVEEEVEIVDSYG